MVYCHDNIYVTKTHHNSKFTTELQLQVLICRLMYSIIRIVYAIVAMIFTFDYITCPISYAISTHTTAS